MHVYYLEVHYMMMMMMMMMGTTMRVIMGIANNVVYGTQRIRSHSVELKIVNYFSR